MEKQPQFIKKFSKEESPNERQQVAQAIRAKRSEYFTEKNVQTSRREELQQAAGERERTLSEQIEAISKLKNKITEISTSRFDKILNYFQIRELQADVLVGQKTYEELKQQQETGNAEEQEISQKFESEEILPVLKEAEIILDNFYKEQKEKWEMSEYTKEDIIKYFSEEHLASLSIDNYSLLLRRFPSEMVTHVTRQGIRDHGSLVYHNAGMGVYADGFMKMVEDGRLRSPLGVYLVEEDKKRAIADFLRLDKFKTKEEASEHLATITRTVEGNSGSYADSMAVHFATEEVADSFYGSEKGNEIFITYPSAYIASQYYFKGQLNGAYGGYHNDQWVWANEERGVDLNAGIVFIPEEVKVDRKTGSRYELDENKNPVKNLEYLNAFQKVLNSTDFHDFAKQVMAIIEQPDWYQDDLSSQKRKLLQQLEYFHQKLEQEFGITDRRLQRAILDHSILRDLDFAKTIQKEFQESYEGDKEKEAISYSKALMESSLHKEGLLYIEARDTVNAKEFWGEYFTKNPAKKPSKIIYYQGSDPTEALYRWRKKQGIDEKTKNEHIGFDKRQMIRNNKFSEEGKSIGFTERNVGTTAPQATAGLDRFKTLAEKVIEDYFRDKQ